MDPMPRVAFLTLGCDKNRVDTERSLYALAEAGFELCPAPEPADALVINTCGFITAAKEESIETIYAAAKEKARGRYQVVAVVGCLVKRYRKELERGIPEVDLWMGLDHERRLAAALSNLLSGAGFSGAGLKPARTSARRIITTPPHYAYLKIAEGCNSACRYCAIPQIRGRLCSTPLEALVAEAQALSESGVKELNLAAQDLTAYGRDLKPRLELADLLERLLAETNLPWLRLLYAHPARVNDRLISLLAREDRLLRYLDLPLQHVSDKMLAAMGRKPGRKGIETLLDRLQSQVPGLALRTTFLVGFPGETKKDFRELLEFVAEGRFTWASGFIYSPEEGTPAAKLSGRVKPEIAEERLFALFDAQREITSGKLSGLVGRELTVLVDQPWGMDEGVASPGAKKRTDKKIHEWQARFSGQAVEVDGVVKLIGEARPGEFARAKVEESWEYDLKARKI